MTDVMKSYNIIIFANKCRVLLHVPHVQQLIFIPASHVIQQLALILVSMVLCASIHRFRIFN